MYYIVLLLVLAALVVVLFKTKSAAKKKEKTVSLNAATTTVQEVDVVRDYAALECIAKEAAKERFYEVLVMTVNSYFKSKSPDKERTLVLIRTRRRFYAESVQKATQLTSEANLRLVNRLEKLQEFCEKTIGVLMLGTVFLSKRKQVRFRKVIKPFAQFTETLQENGGARVAHVFYAIPSGEEYVEDTPFEAAYRAVYCNEDLKDILDKINFNFGEFDQLMSDVAEAKIELVEAGKIASDAKYEWSEFESYCKSSGEIQTILAASEKSGNA